MGARSTVYAQFLPLERRGCQPLIQMLLAGRTKPARNGHSEGPLNLLPVLLHTEPGKCVRFHGRGGLELRFKNHGVSATADRLTRSPMSLANVSFMMLSWLRSLAESVVILGVNHPNWDNSRYLEIPEARSLRTDFEGILQPYFELAKVTHVSRNHRQPVNDGRRRDHGILCQGV